MSKKKFKVVFIDKDTGERHDIFVDSCSEHQIQKDSAATCEILSIKEVGPYNEDKSDERMSQIGQNGNTGEHYAFGHPLSDD